MTYSSAASPVCVWASASREEEAELLSLSRGDGIKGGDFPVDRAAPPDGKDAVIESTRPFFMFPLQPRANADYIFTLSSVYPQIFFFRRCLNTAAAFLI